MKKQIVGLVYGFRKYKSDMLWGLFVWGVFSLVFALAPCAFVLGESYFRGESVRIVSVLAERGDLSLVCIGILASAVGKFADAWKQRFKLRLAIASLGIVGISLHLIFYTIIRLEERQLDTNIVENFYANAFVLTVMLSAIVVLWAELKPYNPRAL